MSVDTENGTLPAIGITMGDPAGIGPEIITKALAREETWSICRPVIIGDTRVMQLAAGITNLAADTLEQTQIIDPSPENDMPHRWGRATARNGAVSAAYVEHAARLALDGEIAGVVTAPLNKEALHLARVPFPGHTELLGHVTEAADFAMMLLGPELRVVHVSTHVSLGEAIKRVKKERIIRVAMLAEAALSRQGIETPRIAVAGLNPHAGEAGLFGREEIEEIIPAIEVLRHRGLDVSGPHPADTVFWHARNGHFDIVVVMYHDQGHIPTKLLGFDDAINVTIGLPIVRASVDHGTAYDIAGEGIASDASLMAALRYVADVTASGRKGEDQENARSV